MPIEIVPIEPDHVEGLHATLDAVARERRYLAMTEAPPLASVRAFVHGNLENRNPQLVAVDAGAVVGWCDVFRKDWPVQRHSGVLGMGVLATHRGRGLGRALLSATLAASKAASFTRVELTVYEDNARAIALYEKAGFEREGLVRNCALFDGRYVHAILMSIIDLDRTAGAA